METRITSSVSVSGSLKVWRIAMGPYQAHAPDVIKIHIAVS